MLKKCLWGRVVGILDWRRFPNVKTGREDHGCTRHFGNETDFFQEVLLKNHILSFVHNIYDENGRAGLWILTNGKRSEAQEKHRIYI